MRDLLCGVNYCAWPAKLRHGSRSVIDASAPFLRQFAEASLTFLQFQSFLFLSGFQFRYNHLHSLYTRQSRSRVEYLIPSYNNLVLLLHSNLARKTWLCWQVLDFKKCKLLLSISQSIRNFRVAWVFKTLIGRYRQCVSAQNVRSAKCQDMIQ